MSAQIINNALWAVAEVERATGVKTGDKWCAWRVEIDSRKVQAGDLFVALKGENFDGHDFVEQAFSKGAIAAIVEPKVTNPHVGFVQNKSPCGGNQLIVPNALKALEDLGKYNRARSHAKIIGITGSVGKTSTKEMLRLALSVHGKTYATNGNYNNHIGTPLNLANMPMDTKFGVFEMGMNHTGEILHLTQMVRPHIALISRVEAAHLEFFSGIEEIAAAKAEIFEGLEPDGIAVINADQPYFQQSPHQSSLRAQQSNPEWIATSPLAPRNDRSTITFGESENADCRLISYTPTNTGCNISANISGESINYKLSAIGKHWAVISLSVLAVCHALKLDIHKSASALAGFSEVEGRGRLVEIKVAGGTATIIDDSYNASPASMRAAFAKTREVWAASGSKGRKVAILGDMLELGETAAEIHARLAEDLQKEGFNVVHTAGKLIQNLHDALPADMRGAYAEKAGELLTMLDIMPQDIVLIKGSHGSKMYELAKKLIADR